MTTEIDYNRIVKFVYHFIAFLFLVYLAYYVKDLSVYGRSGLVFIAAFHLYDTWWFYEYTVNAPI